MCITETDEGLLENLKNRLFTYNLGKYFAFKSSDTLPGVQDFFTFQNAPKVESCNVVYMYILDEPPDDKETIKLFLHDIGIKFGINKTLKYLVVVGDGKTYDHLSISKMSMATCFHGYFHILGTGTYLRIIKVSS